MRPAETTPMTTYTKRTFDLLSAGQVRRWHTLPNIPAQTDADHSWGVAMLILMIEPHASAALLREAILHDTHEIMFGDLPHRTKQDNPELKRIEEETAHTFRRTMCLPPVNNGLSATEKVILEVADRLEAYIYMSINPVASFSSIYWTELQKLVGWLEQRNVLVAGCQINLNHEEWTI